MLLKLEAVPAAATRPITADKIASAAGRLPITGGIRLSLATLTPRVGDVVAVRVSSENPAYDRLELASGRLARLSVGDVVVGVLGERRALKGYVGDVPSELAVGDELAVLNLGGVLGRCTGYNQSLGGPVRAEFLGGVLLGGEVANIGDLGLPYLPMPATPPPVVMVAGSCMHAGKTRVACELVKRFSAAGWRVAAGKVSGVACLKDTLEMADNGAVATLSFLDFGLPSTVGVPDLGKLSRALVAHLAATAPDVVVLELGDGLLGGYNAATVLDDPVMRRALGALVFCAGDFVSAWGGVELLRRKSLVPDVISGAATDSRMGVDFIRRELGVPAANAVANGAALFAQVEAKLLAAQAQAEAQA